LTSPQATRTTVDSTKDFMAYLQEYLKDGHRKIFRSGWKKASVEEVSFEKDFKGKIGNNKYPVLNGRKAYGSEY
jgi:hypothetical protein